MKKQRVGCGTEWKAIKVNNIIIWILFRMRDYPFEFTHSFEQAAG